MILWLWYLYTLKVVVKICYSAPLDNGLAEEPEIHCGPDTIGAKFSVRSPFEGRVFVQGHFRDPKCRSEATNTLFTSLDIPFSTCETRRTRSVSPRGVTVDVTLVISFHPQFITKIDRSYSIRCFYMEGHKTINAELEVSMLPTSIATQTVQMPNCKYEVLQDGPKGKPVKYVRVGDKVYHRWTCIAETPDNFCMTVHSCFVNDGSGENVQLLDENGCAIDRYILSNLEYTSQLTAGRATQVFKYADRQSVWFNCQISISGKDNGSLKDCSRATCVEPIRGKRAVEDNSTSTIVSTSEVDVHTDKMTVLDMDTTNGAAIDYKLTQTESRDDICMTKVMLSLFVTSILIVILSCSFFISCMCRKTFAIMYCHKRSFSD